jgi:ubiquinone/menaquinone biosynthesis C-methylase UbiE
MATFEMHQIAERYHRIMNPYSEAKMMLLGEICQMRAGMRQLDLACGKGEMLCRYAQTYGISGLGVDYFQGFLDAAAVRAGELGVADKLTWVLGDAGQYTAEAAAFDVVSCIGATWIGGEITGTIKLMQKALKPGGLLLVGEPFWAEDTPDEAYAPWGMKKGEFVTLAETLTRIESTGMNLVEMVLGNQDDWDRYEAAQWFAVDEHLHAHPEDPTAQEAYAWKAQEKRAYLQYARRYFGWGVFVLR